MLFRSFTLRIEDADLRTELSLAVVDKIMEKYQLGQYEEENSTFDLNLLNLDIESDQTEHGLFLFLFSGLNATFSEIPLSKVPESYEKIFSICLTPMRLEPCPQVCLHKD